MVDQKYVFMLSRGVHTAKPNTLETDKKQSMQMAELPGFTVC